MSLSYSLDGLANEPVLMAFMQCLQIALRDCIFLGATSLLEPFEANLLGGWVVCGVCGVLGGYGLCVWVYGLVKWRM